MAHKKAAGSVKNGRDSVSKRLGVKVFGSESVRSGQVLVRQRGTKFHAGAGVKRTADDTLIATVDGVLAFIKKKVVAFNGNLKKRTYLRVEAQDTTTQAKPSQSKKKSKKVVKEKAAPKTEKKVAVKKTKATSATKKTVKKSIAKKPVKKTTTKTKAKKTTTK